MIINTTQWLVEATYNCSECCNCTVLLRRYRLSERMAVPSHYDRIAYLTAVASLNPIEFDGGLFLQRTPRADSREFFAVGSRDLIFHSYDLNHDVEVLSGGRYSVIFWITDSEASCRNGISPWYMRAAEQRMPCQDSIRWSRTDSLEFCPPFWL